jgi:hypothetical protein
MPKKFKFIPPGESNKISVIDKSSKFIHNCVHSDEPSFSGTGHLQPQAGTSPNNSSSARSASWCAEVNGDHLRRLQISGGGGGCDGPPRTARSELNVDNSNEGNEVFYTPRMGRNEVTRKESSRKGPKKN